MITEKSNEENQVLGTHDKNVHVTCYMFHISKSKKGVQNITAIPQKNA